MSFPQKVSIQNLIRWLVYLSLMLAALPGCTTSGLPAAASSAFTGWTYRDLRFLQAATDDPQHSLIGVYTRQSGFDLEIRLDFLDLSAPIDFDTYLALDTQGSGSSILPFAARAGLPYDLLIEIPAQGLPIAMDASQRPMNSLIPRVVDDPSLDTLVITLNRTGIPGNVNGLELQAWITPAGAKNVISSTPAILSGTPRPAQAPLLMVFWNTLPSATPVQTLRRWDGAHTGPLGGRHGLANLLNAAENQGVPLILADLKQATSLAGLNAVNGTDTVLRATLRGDVFLPDVANGDPLSSAQSLALNLSAAQKSGFSIRQAAFGAFKPPLAAGYPAYFAQLSDPTHIAAWQGTRLVPLPGPIYPSGDGQPDQPVDQNGLSLPIREQLLATALSGDPGKLVVLGGSLPGSAWGEFSVAPAAFAYLAAHSWIRPLSWQDVTNLPIQYSRDWPLPAECNDLLCSPGTPDISPYTSTGRPIPSGMHYAQLKSILRSELADLPADSFTGQAWAAYMTLTQPTTNTALAGLQANALGEISYLIQAARWQASPAARADCQEDIDMDGLPECVLASPAWFVVVKTDGGRLVFAASRSAKGVTQWIAPYAQFAVGLSDPSEWRPEKGAFGDPGNVPGAFALANAMDGLYKASIQANELILKSEDGTAEKRFAITPLGLSVHLTFSREESVSIPLTLAPQDWVSAKPDDLWKNPPKITPDSWQWQPVSGPGLQIGISGAASQTASSFLDSSALMKTAEDPNLAYPKGHYLPYPFALITITGSQLNLTFSTQ
jgi:hypothetical protein